MQLNRWKMFGLAALTTAVVVIAAAPGIPVQAAWLPDAASDVPEVRRIHAHFDSVMSELRLADASRLTSSQVAHRQSLMATLRGYDERAEFPHNYDFAAPTPYFVDRQTGTLCAVAFLLESTGRRDIVERVARFNNNVWIGELNADTAMGSWLHENGITLAEAARIQVPYTGDQPPSNVQGGSNKLTYVSAGAALATLATSAGMTAYNVLGNGDGHGRKRAVLGLVSGMSTSIVGAVIASQPTSSDRTQARVGGVGVAIGALGMAAATRSLLHRSTFLAAQSDAESTKRASVETNISPILPIGKNTGTGLSMSIRF